MFDQFTEYDFPTFGYIKMPKIKPSNEEKGLLRLEGDVSVDEYLTALVRASMIAKLKSGEISKEDKKAYGERAKEELDAFTSLGFSSYILLIYKIIDFCNKKGIALGPGRGSAAGSLCFWMMGITQVDPIKHSLLFSRFISASRAEKKEINGELYVKADSLPDVDIDVDHARKDEVKNYLEEIYPNRTTQIATISKFKTKIVLKDTVKKMLGYSEEEAQGVANMIEEKFGKADSISESIEKKGVFADWAEKNPEAIVVAKQVENLVRNKSVHPAGVLLCERPVRETIPLQYSSDGKVVSAFDMNIAQMLGIKIDILALRTLSVVREAAAAAGIQYNKINVNDPSIYKFLSSTDCYYGLFQVEEGLGKETLLKIKPQNVEDISLSLAIGRPGSMAHIDEIVKYRETGELEDIDERISSVLRSTANIIVYQEQLMRISMVVGGFSEKESNDIRKATGKKIKEKMLKYKDSFLLGADKNGFDKKVAEKLWASFEATADYSFNKSHSCAYAYLTAITAYLKANHTTDFFVAMLNQAENEQKPFVYISKIFRELNHFGIKLLPPSLSKSGTRFEKVGEKTIRTGINSIKGISEKALEKLNDFGISSEMNKFELFEAAIESKINVSVFENLIRAGCLDDFSDDRAKLVLEARCYSELTKRERVQIMKIAEEHNCDLVGILQKVKAGEIKGEDGKLIMKTEGTEKRRSRWETFYSKAESYINDFMRAKKNPDLYNLIGERAVLGWGYSSTLGEVLKEGFDRIQTIEEILTLLPNESVLLACSISDIAEKKSKKGNIYLNIDVVDETGELNMKVFSGSRGGELENTIEKIKNKNGRLPKKEDICLVRGTKKSDNMIFVENLKILT